MHTFLLSITHPRYKIGRKVFTTHVLDGGCSSQLLDLRGYIAALKSAHEVQEIAQEVELDLEIGAIIRRCYETGSSAPLFQRIRGVAPGFRILGAPAGVSRQPGRKFVRIALSLDMEPESTGREIVEAFHVLPRGQPLDRFMHMSHRDVTHRTIIPLISARNGPIGSEKVLECEASG